MNLAVCFGIIFLLFWVHFHEVEIESFAISIAQVPSNDTLKFEEKIANPESRTQAELENQARWDKAMEFADWEISQGKMFISDCNPLNGVCQYGWDFPPDGTFIVTNEYTGEERTIRAYCSDDGFFNETSSQCELTEEGIMNERIRIIIMSIVVAIGFLAVIMYGIRNREKLFKIFNKASEEL